ncbi:reverse transcriptase domain-containing protein [Tanacetum coccineum]|uniref:Reverse transcriptase domain-containing protein n=1 Tax=Tanacetum coccineum TaxID=301880 RepID=A0ABQ4WND6_9ASTR
MVIRSPSPYNGIIGRPRLRKIQAVPSTTHGMLKFPVKEGVVTLHSIPIMLAGFNLVTGAIKEPPLEELATAKRMNKPANITGVPRSIAEHCLNICEGCPPIRQKRRGQAPDRNKAIQEEVSKLVEAQIMREVHYHSWLSNPIMVKKHDGSWRMCVDFADLNKACPKDCYPLPEIDWKVKSLCGYPFKCFLDAYKGYHQIQMAEEDEENTAFHNSQGVFCYTKMPFGLKNAGATYQRLILRDIEETFRTLRRINMKLNPKKCTFGAEEGMFLGHIVNVKGIKACPDKEEEVIQLQSPRTLKEVQSLNGKLASLNRSRTSIRGQVLADFIDEKPKEDEGSGARLILTNLEGTEFTYALRFEFEASNNEAEYKALMARLRIAEQIGVQSLEEKVDSRLVANQIDGSYVAKEQSMVQYLEKARTLISSFKKFSIEEVPKGENKKDYALSKIASTSFDHLTKQVLVEVPKEKSIEETEIHAVVEEEGLRSVVAKAIRSGYYWPTMHKDAQNIIRKCDDYQVHRSVPNNPQQKLTPITSPWPFHKWGIDISGPFPKAQGKVKLLIVTVDYFTKWIEAKPVATITGNQIKKFVWDNIVCRFGLPGEIIFDNEKLFRDNPFKDWCEKLNVKQRLGGDNKNWVEELPHVLWAHRTEIKSSNGHTPCEKADQAMNDEALLLNLDILEEMRENAAIQEARSKAKMEKYYNVKVRSTIFKPEDFVYRSNEASHAKEGGKLGLKWEGPYEVVEALGKGACKIRNGSGDILPRTWNVKDLKKCYL